jgi:cobalt transporter subunit CbtA
MIFRQIVFYSLLAGVLSGAVLTVAQTWQVVPIIHSAEVFEGAAASVPAIEHAGQLLSAHDTAHEHSAGAWAPGNGIERTAYTLLSNVLTAVGFALALMVVMVASSSLKNNAVTRFNWRHGLLWGISGYTVFWLAPALGLPPEIPLAATADLEARQIWWLFTVVSTAAGLAGLAFGKSPWRWAAPLMLLVPHLVGAPHAPGAMFADQPPAAAAQLEQLAQQFIAATAIANIAFWLALGLTSAWAVRRILSPSGNISPSGSELPPEIESSSV